MPKRQKGINKMKKNIFKKIVASLATVAMAAGMFVAMPAEEAKAATTKELVVYISGVDGYDTVYFDIEGQNADITSSAKKENKIGFGRDQYVFTKDSSNSNKYTLTIEGDLPDPKYCNIQIVAAGPDGDDENTDKDVIRAIKYYPQDERDVFNNNSTLYFTINKDSNWSIVKASAADPTKKDPSEVIAAIDAIGTVKYTDECKNKIDDAESKYNTFINVAGGDAADVTNYNKLTAAKAKYAELKAADDAQYVGKITIYAKTPSWDKVSLYGWYIENGDLVFGEWPGKQKLDPMKNNKGWYSCSFDMTMPIGVIFNNDGNKQQTTNWEKMKPGEYWIDFSNAETGTDSYGNTTYKISEDNISTKAPSGWKDEKAQEVTTQAPPTTTPAPTTTKPAVDKGSVASKADVEKIDKEAVVEGAPADAKLDATEIAADSDAFKVVKEAAKTAFKNKTYVALDLKLVKGSEVVQANGDVKVTIPVPTALAKSTKVAVYRVGDDNKLVSCGTADVANGKITFTTNHFSTYVFADASVSANKPGDAAPIVLMLAVAAVAAGMVVASKKKTICE